jgi:hypothetical protein
MIGKTLPELQEWLRQEILAGQQFDLPCILSQYPTIASSPDTVVELIVTAFEAEQARGLMPNVREWLQRYQEYNPKLLAFFLARGHLVAASDHFSTCSGSFWQEEKPLPEALANLPALPPHRILREISRGGMGVVYEAIDLTLGRRVALKVIRAGFLASPHERARFYREACIAASLDHEHVLPVLHYGTFQHEDALTMPLMTGGSLGKWFAQRRELRETIDMLLQVTRGVAYLHRLGLVHRDLKLANVLIDAQGRCRVADFGLAWIADAEPLTQPLQQLGTPGCMAPEQTLGRKVDARADVFALGILFYEALTGQKPFSGRTREELCRTTREQQPIEPRQLRPEIPPELQAILLRCLEKQPENRYAHAGELEQELTAWFEGRPTATPAPSISRLPYWFGSLASMLVFVAVLGLLMRAALGSAPATDRHASVLAALQRGEPVELIGPRGGPSSCRWLQAPDRPLPAIRPLAPYTIEVSKPSLLEILPSVPCQRYRVSANLRMILPKDRAHAGLYVMGSETATPKGIEADCLVLRFHHGQSLVRADASVVSLSAPSVLGASQTRYIDNNCKLYTLVLRGLVVPLHGGDLLTTTAGLHLLVFGQRHHLQIDVSTEQVDFRMDGLPIHSWRRAEDQKLHSFWWNHLRTLPGMQQRPAPLYQVNGSVGIYLSNGAVEITHLRITPLFGPLDAKDNRRR